jgi:hypothetical protein
MVKRKPVEKVKDPRFSKFNTDPKFRDVPEAEKKHQISDRFKEIFTDPNYSGSAVGIDATGKKLEKPENDLKRLYTMKGVECVDEDGNFKWDAVSSDEDQDEDVAM